MIAFVQTQEFNVATEEIAGEMTIVQDVELLYVGGGSGGTVLF
jgi:hypothetical protein